MDIVAALGRPAVVVATGFAALTAALFAFGTARARYDLLVAGRRASIATAGFVAVAAVALSAALFAHDFSYEYVANYSSRSLTGPYTFSALWGGMEGSLLFWTLLLAVFAAASLRSATTKGMSPRLVGAAGAVLAGLTLFFLVLLVIPADPFVRLSPAPADGSGLNPLLQSPGMLIHPPLLYTGFVGFSIPFAFAVGALVMKRLEDVWFTSTRRWTLLAWSALSIGIVLGGAWAYTELGWGGYWAWDPVENASFLPWLTATAYLHSVVIQEKRRMFKIWNISLILITYMLAVFGTFLTRSGILSSIHTFTEGPIGKWFLPFLAAMLLGGVALVMWRLDSLKSENRFDAVISRETAFLANNVLFVVAAFTVLWGTIYPIVAEALWGTRLSVGPPFFNRVFVPIALALLLLAGVGPLISWRSMRARALGRVSTGPALVAVVLVVVLAIAGIRSWGALIAFGLCAFTAASIVTEFVRGGRVYRKREKVSWIPAVGRTLVRNRRRYGGYVVHLGIVLIVLGVAGGAFRTERDAHLSQGESFRVGDYRLVYEDLNESRNDEKQIAITSIGVFRDGERVTTMRPQRNLHFAQEQWQSEIAIRTTPIEDLYVVTTTIDPDGAASIRAFVNPLTWWIWAGAFVMAAGMAIILTGRVAAPVLERKKARVGEAIPVSR
ncbi:MAG: heme lyase CcmF/NrfE family subunit [Actinobacteria bacterium]|nr:heme lyase CcmF/NrfE family subunit [Actinomycetota bacterium]